MKISFLDCPHNNVQDFTECCLDCGYNIWTTKDEYKKDLRKRLEIQTGGHTYKDSETKALEKALSIKENYYD